MTSQNLFALSRRKAIRGVVGAGLATLAAPALDAAETGWVTFDDSAGHIGLQGTLNGRPARMVLDTGAGAINVDRTFAAQIGLRSSAGARTMTAHGQAVHGTWSQPVEVQIGSFIWNAPWAMIAPLSADNSETSAQVILGQMAISSLPMEIDFRHKRLRLITGEVDLVGAVRLPLRRRADNLRFVDISLGGGKPVSALFDTGSPHALIADRSVARDTPGLSGRRMSDDVLVNPAG